MNSINILLVLLTFRLDATAHPKGHGSPSSIPVVDSTDVLYQFPNGTWIENLAVRSNGGIVATVLTAPQLLYFDPTGYSKVPRVIHTFPAPATGLTGITEVEPDVFYVTSLNFTFKESLLSLPKGTGVVWKVNMTGSNSPLRPAVSRVAKLPDIQSPNGILALPSTNRLLIADSIFGVVWRLNISSGKTDVILNSTLTHSTLEIAVEALHERDGYLYFSNAGAGIYARVSIDRFGSTTGKPELLTQNSTVGLDDFKLYGGRGSEAALLCDDANDHLVYSSGLSSSSFVSFANIKGPTSIAFGRRRGDEHNLYVTSNGGRDAYVGGGPVPVGGAITKLFLRQ